MSVARILAALILLSTPATAQSGADWGDLDGVLFSTLTTSGAAEASYWLPNATTPDQTTEAVGVVYEHIPGSAGSVSIAVGVFRRAGSDFVLVGRVNDVFGMVPADPAHYPDRIEFSTSTLTDTDPRCCPSGTTRWAIDRTTLTARKVE
jgi:hypothetical protein